MKVKSVKEITNWLLEHGYRYDTETFEHETELSFAYSMFQYCEKEPPVHYTWKKEWLEAIPEDYIGKICSVWNIGYEPKLEDRYYRRIDSFTSDVLLSFLSQGYAYSFARPIEPDELSI